MIPEDEVSVDRDAYDIMVILLQLGGGGSLRKIEEEWRFLASLKLLTSPRDRRSIRNCIQTHQLGQEDEDNTAVFESAPIQIYSDSPPAGPFATSPQIWRLREEYFDIAKQYQKADLGPMMPCSHCRSFPYPPSILRRNRRSNPYLCPNSSNYSTIDNFGGTGEAEDRRRASERYRLWSKRVLSCPHFSDSQDEGFDFTTYFEWDCEDFEQYNNRWFQMWFSNKGA
jgi:hypothetical protein